MRLLFWRKAPEEGPRAPPTPFDKWLLYGRVGALAAAVLLLAISVVPLSADWSAPNEGGDVNVTVEFYTAFERGGGFITWDFSPQAARALRASIDADGDGVVSAIEARTYATSVESQLESRLVIRNFEVGGVRIDEQRGLIGEPVNSSSGAHLHLTLSGQWATRDADIALAKDGVVALAYGDFRGFERVHERTILINGGLATFTTFPGQARVLRVPGGTVIVSTDDYTSSSATGAGSPDVQFVRFSLLESSIVLLAPLAIAYFVGILGARREQEATRQPRVVPLHNLLSALFLLLLVAYFAGVFGAVLWIGGVAFGVGSLFLAYRFYPAERRPLDEPVPAARRLFESRKGRVGEEVSEGEAARGLGLTVEEWRKKRSRGEAVEPAADPAAVPIAEAAALLEKAHGPLETAEAKTPDPEAPGLAAARDLLPKALTPLELPDEETPRPEGREVVAHAGGTPLPLAPAVPAAPAAPPSPAMTRVRCPGCKHYFEAEGTRPLSVTCPHCGRRGVLR